LISINNKKRLGNHVIQKKICLLGSFSVCKTSLISRYVNSLFSEKYLTTVGVKIDKKTLSIAGQDLMLMIWDIAGEDDFSSIRDSYLKGLAGYVIVMDGTRINSYHTGIKIYERVRSISGEIPVVFAINKADLKAEWQLETAHLKQLDQYGYPVLETSAKLDSGVDTMFISLATQLMVKHG
jgi:hypothetical protein